MEGLEFDSIRDIERVWLERKFEKERDRGDFSDCKKLGRGQSFRFGWFYYDFYHHCWRVVEKDVLAVFEEFFQHCKFEKSLNVTFIILIPKKNDATNIRDF